MPIPPAAAAASSGRSQMKESHAVAETPTQHNSRTDESRMDDDGEERERRIQKFDSTEHQTTNCDKYCIVREQK